MSYSRPSSDSSYNNYMKSSSSFNPASGSQQFGQGLGSFMGGMFGPSGEDAYKEMMKQYKKYYGQAADYQQPFFDAGTGAIPDYQNWLKGMSDPSQFMNNLMGDYQESPYAQYMQDQSMRAAQNMGSASGLSGSTPLTQFAQENSANIASQDMNQWLQNVLGINTQYGSGLNNMMGYGQNAGNQLTNLYQQLGQLMGQGAYGKEMAKMQQSADIWGGLGNMVGGGLGMMTPF